MVLGIFTIVPQHIIGAFLSGLIVSKMIFKGYKSYSTPIISTRTVGIRVLDTRPTTAASNADYEKIWDEAKSGNKVADLLWPVNYETFELDLTSFIKTTEGKAFLNNALTNGWGGFGFTCDYPTTEYSSQYCYLQGYTTGTTAPTLCRGYECTTGVKLQ